MSLRSTLSALVRDSDEGATLPELAAAAGVPPTTARFHLDALVADGVVERGSAPPTGRGRPRAVYRSRRRMDPAGPRDYLGLAHSLVDALSGVPDGAERARRAGEQWAARLDLDAGSPAEALREAFTQVGFEPEELPAAPGEQCRIALRHCPFLELARTAPEITCAVHRGLMRGTLSRCGADSPAELLPFAGGDHCLAVLRDRAVDD